MKAVAREIDLRPIKKFLLDENGKYKSDILLAIQKISRQHKLSSKYGGPIDILNPGSEALARAVLNAIVNRNTKEANLLADLFENEDYLFCSIGHIIQGALEVGSIADVISELY